MPYYSCPNCGSSISDAVGPAPTACPACCAQLHLEGDPDLRFRGPERRPRPVVRMPLGSDSDAPFAARHALAPVKTELGDARYHVCQLLVSELVTNVVRHSPEPRSLAAADMRVRLYGDRVRVEVRDDGPGFRPRPRADDQDLGSGWGLHLVDQLADDWGVEPGVQNCVWFELGRTPLPSGVHAAAHS